MHRFALWLACSALVLTTLAGCDGGGTAPAARCRSSSDCRTGLTCVDGTCRMAPDAGPGVDGGGLPDAGGFPDAYIPHLTGLSIDPPSSLLTATDGAMPTLTLHAIGHFDDGTMAMLPAAFWTADAPVLGAIDRSTGVYTAGGIVAGTTTITAMASGQMATATISIVIDRTVVTTGTPADAASHFTGAGTADPASAGHVLYPLGNTRMPQNVFPADVQWENGNAGDIYQVRMDTTGVHVRGLVLHTGGGFHFDWLPPRDAWRALAESAPESDVTIAVDRWDAASGTTYTGAPVTFRFADATIRGAIYYWDLGAGRIQRISGDGSGLTSFMPNPPRRPSDGRQCVACHAISRDGRRMAAELWDGGDFGAVFDLTGDTTADPPPMIITPTVQRFLFASFSPDNGRLVANNGNMLFLMDGNTGASVAAGGAGLPTAGAAHPTWSPDGNQIAFVTNTNGGWAVDFTHGDLAVIDVMPGDTFAAPRMIHAAGSPAVIAHPSWSPDSRFISYHHGSHSRAYEDRGGGVLIFQPASVEMVSRDGASVYTLANLNGSAPNSYYPTFSPFDEGGYYWLAFFSTRDYGNAQAGTRGTGRRQLWVAAVSSSPAGTGDPSFAPYWIPQQDVAHENMAAYWTQEPCHMDGLSCATSGECCSGFCRDVGAGAVCVPPSMVMCSHEGEACVSDGDCCTGDMTTCIANRCGRFG